MAETPYYPRRVWDPVVRVLHWWMAITLLVQFTLAGIVYTVFFIVGASQVITGASLYTIGEDNLGEVWEEVHKIGFWVLVAYVVLHLVMVAVHEVTERRGLISAMVNGRKLFAGDELERHPAIRSEEE